MIDKYQPSLIYFDSRLNFLDERHLTGVISYYYNQAERWQEEVSVTYKEKDLPWGVGILDIERGRLGTLASYKWLTDDAIDWNSWCHVQSPSYKSADRIVDELVDIVSKNGCFLLDLTPTAEGVIPEPVVERLLAIGEWLTVNGEAIYGTRPWKLFGEGPTEIESGMFGEEKTPDFTAQERPLHQSLEDPLRHRPRLASEYGRHGNQVTEHERRAPCEGRDCKYLFTGQWCTALLAAQQ